MMTVTKPGGSEDAARWWVGKTLTCSHCGTQITLEKPDTPVAYLTDTKRVVSVTCPTCGHGVELSEKFTSKE